jgi:hypothetical protein
MLLTLPFLFLARAAGHPADREETALSTGESTGSAQQVDA